MAPQGRMESTLLLQTLAGVQDVMSNVGKYDVYRDKLYLNDFIGKSDSSIPCAYALF